MKTFSSAALLLGLSLAFVSCKKEQIDPPGVVQELIAQKLQGANDQALAAIMDAVQQALAQIPALVDSLPAQPVGTCPTVTVTPASNSQTFPATVKLDFGTGCTAKSGNEFAGSITVVVSGKVDSVGSSIVATMTDLKVDGNKVSGKITMTTSGGEGVAYQNLAFVVSNFSVTNTEGKSMIIKEMEGARIQTAGQSTTPQNTGQAAYNDDSFEISFSGEGVDADGKNFTLETTANLLREYDCRYIVSGKVVYKVGPIANAADYGSGSCDNLLKVTVAGVEKTIELP